MPQTSSAPATSAGWANQVRTTVWAPFGLSACLRYAEDLFESRDWRPLQRQVPFMEEIFIPAKGVIDLIPEDQLRCIAAASAEAINEFLRKHGSGKLQLGPFQDGNSVGFAAVTRVLVKWAMPGTRTTMTRAGREPLAAAKLKSGIQLQRSGTVDLVKIRGRKPGTFAYVAPMRPDLVPATQDVVSLVRLCRELGHNAAPGGHCDSVIFPMVDLELQPDLSWILELELKTSARPLPMFVRQAVQLLAFKMNHLGAAFRDEVAIEMAMRGMSPPPFTIEPPFLFWMGMGGLEGLPLFAGVMNEDVCKDPGDSLSL